MGPDPIIVEAIDSALVRAVSRETARAERAEAAIQRVRRLAVRWKGLYPADVEYVDAARELLAALDSTDRVEDAPTRAVIVSDDFHGHKLGEEVVDGPPFPADFGSGQLRRAERKPTRGQLDAPAPTRSGEPKTDERGHDIATGRPCDIYVPPEYCSEPTRCRVHRRSVAGLPADGEERTDG